MKYTSWILLRHDLVFLITCSSKQTAVVRASDDFYPRDPLSHVIHIASVSYNSIFLGEFMQPDWDMFHVTYFITDLINLESMPSFVSFQLGHSLQLIAICFQSLHPAAEYHAAARAIGGCPIYVRYR